MEFCTVNCYCVNKRYCFVYEKSKSWGGGGGGGVINYLDDFFDFFYYNLY